MDAERLAELTRWASGLERSDSSELRAAGRAIRALCADNAELSGRLAALERERGEDEPPPAAPGGSGTARRARRTRRPRGFPFRRAAIVAAAVLVASAVVVLAARAAAPEIDVTGPADGAVLGGAALASLAFASAGGEGATWRLDGRVVEPERRGGRWVLRPQGLRDGRHELVVSRTGSLFTSGSRTIAFTVDTTAPRLRLDRPAAVSTRTTLTVAGSVGPGARLTVDGKPVRVDAAGRFTIRRATPPRRLLVLAGDEAGNRSRWRVPVTIVPRRPKQPIRSVHVTAYGWADRTLRAGVLRLIDERRINAVELDLKDESGEIGWHAPVPLARRMGAALRVFDLEQAVAQLHAKGVRVIGRLVCFRDPIHARAAWEAGRRDEVVQTPGGAPYAGYGGFTNFANAAVRKYNIDVAVAAARAGVDEILYDYVRRPDGPTSRMVFAGLRGMPEQAVAAFLSESRRALAPAGVLVGVSVFGVAATRPWEVAQDIPAMAREVDYIAPMLYPSHWGPGEYRVADPNGSPYEIVRRSLADFQRQVRGTGARVVPWLQDFSLGRTYGPAEVAAQIRAARDARADEFILWDPLVTYTAEALPRTARVPALGLAAPSATDAPWPVRLPLAKPRATKAAAAARRPLSGVPPNELGVVPVVMHHQIRPDRVGEYDQTPQEFRAELERLWREGYVPVRVSDLLDGRLDLPKGTSPVVMTFDDATKEQLALDGQGRPRSGTAIAIVLDFARTHPGFEPAGTFYVNREPFAVEDATPPLRWLVEHGFELGNHTHDHVPLGTVSDEEVQKQLAAGAEVITKALPGYRIRSLSLPLGSQPRTARLAVRGSWNGRAYGPYAVLLVGAGPAPSPFSRRFDRTAIPRIRTSHAGWDGTQDFGFAYWMRELERKPASRYVSDGDPRAITAPADAAAELAPRFRSRFVER
jgi:peptidoglycan/xylan/chitin deacetylase (PgdA/CDA1 family)